MRAVSRRRACRAYGFSSQTLRPRNPDLGEVSEGAVEAPSDELKPSPPAELALAQAERLGRHLEQLVLADPLEALLEAHAAGRGQLDGLVRGGRAHVGELLLLGDVDVDVGLARVLADDLALVDLDAGPDEHGAARLEVVDRVGGCPPGPVGAESAVCLVADVGLSTIPHI